MINWILGNTALFVALICGLALWVSLVVENIKDYIPQLDPKAIVMIVALVGTAIMYICGSAYLGIAFIWFEAIPLILGFVFVGYIAEYGYDSLVKRYKDIANVDETFNEEGIEEGEE